MPEKPELPEELRDWPEPDGYALEALRWNALVEDLEARIGELEAENARLTEDNAKLLLSLTSALGLPFPEVMPDKDSDA